VPIEDLAEPSRLVQRLDYQLSIRPADHTPYLPSHPTSVREIERGLVACVTTQPPLRWLGRHRQPAVEVCVDSATRFRG
jgi:hypothetical protein